ncbi:hypothetical protein [Spirosoma lituiforme]
MKDLLAKLNDLFEFDHTAIALASLISAVLTSGKNDVGLPILVRTLNVLSGFCLASLVGFALLEAGWLPWLSSGIAYAVGNVGNRLMNGMLTAAKLFEVDPLSFTGRVISLIWEFKLPTLKKDNGNQ